MHETYEFPAAQPGPPVQPGEVRAAGLRRLSRLTWRATQLSALTAVGVATLFARTAPAQTAGHNTTAPAGPTSSATLGPSASASASASAKAERKRARATASASALGGVRPTARAGTQASTQASTQAKASPAAAAPAKSATLAPPSTAPAPAPSSSSAPAPAPTVSSASHGGG